MRRLSTLALAVAAFAAVLPAQGPLAVGTHDVAWANQSGLGTPVLAARVCYPSPTGGVDAPILPATNGWPVVVFLHGFSLLGSDYSSLGAAWASEGFAVVLLDTAQFTPLDQEADGRAMFAALATANLEPTEFFHGAFDTRRIGVAGHSVGGGTMGLILSANPGYRCGFALAPVSPGSVVAAQVTVPFGLVVGTGDIITPAAVFSRPYYAAVAPSSGLKFWFLMDRTCTHMNLVGLAPGARVFARTTAIGVGFFRHFLDVDPNGIERCLGPAVTDDVTVIGMMQQIVEPRIWASGPLSIGSTVRMSVAAEPGVCGILAAAELVSGVPTAFGTLQLDAASLIRWSTGIVARPRRHDAWLTVPFDLSLIGTKMAFQAIGASTESPFQLGSAAEFVITQ
jgi:hypothetical protein